MNPGRKVGAYPGGGGKMYWAGIAYSVRGADANPYTSRQSSSLISKQTLSN